jgi:hypothetical protein
VPDVTDDQTPSEERPEAEVEELAPATDLALRGAVLELERHAAETGWDQPARLFALVLTEELLANEPSLAGMLEVDTDADLTGSLTPIEQDELPAEVALEQLLSEMMWPEAVHGTAVIVERLVLPPTVELPEDETAAQQVAESHPERQEVRMVAGATRSGSTYCALRLRAHDEDFSVIEGPDLVPALLELLQSTLVPAEPGALDRESPEQ